MTLDDYKLYFSTPVCVVKTPFEIFYDDDLMPCCGNKRKIIYGPLGRLFINITCAHCGEILTFFPFVSI